LGLGVRRSSVRKRHIGGPSPGGCLALEKGRIGVPRLLGAGGRSPSKDGTFRWVAVTGFRRRIGHRRGRSLPLRGNRIPRCRLLGRHERDSLRFWAEGMKTQRTVDAIAGRAEAERAATGKRRAGGPRGRASMQSSTAEATADGSSSAQAGGSARRAADVVVGQVRGAAQLSREAL